MKVKKQMLSLKAYEPGKSIDNVKKELGLTEIVNLASNENPFGCSEKVQQALQAVSNYARYPDSRAEDLRGKVANHLRVSENQLLFSSGLDEMIQMISRSLLSPETNVVMASFTFPQFRHHAVIENTEIRDIPLKDGRHDLEGMQQAVDEQTSLVWICNPNNPTGTYVNETEIRSFLEAIPNDTIVVLDEAYYEYVTASDYPDSMELIDEYDNLLVLRTFSKGYGLAAFRIGYAIGHEELMSKLDIGRLPFNTSRFAQIAAQAALSDEAFVRNCSERNFEGLQQFYTFCNEFKVPYYPSQGNFIYIEPGKNPEELFQFLIQRGYIVRPIKDGVRITIGKKEDNEGLIKLLKEFMENETSSIKLTS
ncbi:histidinol-phosphate transaminase [Pseudalkalibacillus salsuginis]|uniref:histidinol-phosphate transaminase n=1 Tax=Pseudalkalibacillus salsuginis TaxID=2910972 RepID=UPI001F4506C0|nr:histidinol-phosphate transaminase [Pseudalkalibacillus salsuginis]MCF6411956.1 histidinol-phosphate transaminase [Pseudalkalibacillus salsuginis]